MPKKREIEDIGSMNVEKFIDSLSGDDHNDALEILMAMNGLEFSMSVNNTLDYCKEHYQFDDHNVYEEFSHIVTKPKQINLKLD